MISYKDQIKLDDSYASIKKKCKCGHTIPFTKKMGDRVLCRWCGHWLYKDKETEFRYKINEVMNNEQKRVYKEMAKGK